MIVVGDSFHNFTDGVIIASAFLADTKLGVVTAIAIVAHEIPQEIGDFVVLLHSGFSKRRALMANALSGFAMVVGALLGYFALSAVSGWIPEILAIAAASMIYVAVADLIPGLHKRTEIRETLLQVAFIVLGVGTIWIIHALLFPES
jgi:zinc and cadmium transporter